MLAWIMFGLGLFVGLGDMLGGYDRYIYAELFDNTADTVLSGKNPLKIDGGIMGYANERAYVYLNVLLAHFTANRYIFILIVTLFIYALLYDSLKTYFEEYPFAILLFLGLFYFFTYTYLRQVLATCFTWYSFRFIIKRKFIPYLLCVIIAYNFHNSAIIFFPMYFVPIKKYSKRTIIIAMVAFLLIGTLGLSTSLYSMYGDVSGTDSRTEQYGEDRGFRIDYVIEVVLFLYFILKNYHTIPSKDKDLVFLNASLLFFGVLLAFIKSSTAGRQTWYFMIGLIYTLNTVALTKQRINNYGKVIYLITFLMFCRIIMGWGIYLSPYKTFLTNGYRQGDHIHNRYEYDSHYDKDKFYRPVLYIK